MYRDVDQSALKVSGKPSPIYESAGSIISRNERGCLEKIFFADDSALVIESLEGLKGKLEAWKKSLKSKRLTVNVKQI